MTTPARAAAQPFSTPQEEPGQQLAKDIALIMHYNKMCDPHRGVSSAYFLFGHEESLHVFSRLYLPHDFTKTELDERHWGKAELSVIMSGVGSPNTKTKLFSATCNSREALRGHRPIDSLESFQFVPEPYEPGPWSEGLHQLANSLRHLNLVDARNYNKKPQPVRWHAT